MIIWYCNNHTGRAYNARTGTFATIMACNESYWIVPGTEMEEFDWPKQNRLTLNGPYYGLGD